MLWIILVALPAVVAAPFLLGMLLPRTYRGRLRLLLAGRTPAEVWAVLCGAGTRPVAGVLTQHIEALEDAEEGVAWVEHLGHTRLIVRTLESASEERLVLRVEDQSAPVSSVWSFELEPHEEGTLVRALNETEIAGGDWHGPIFRLAMAGSDGAHKVLREYFRDVAGDLGVTATAFDPE